MKFLDKFDALSVPFERQIEAAEPIASQRVRSALQYNGGGLESLHDLSHDRDEDGFVRLIVNPIAKWDVDCIILPTASTNVSEIASAGEKFTVLVEAHGHDAISCEESFFDSIPMMNV